MQPPIPAGLGAHHKSTAPYLLTTYICSKEHHIMTKVTPRNHTTYCNVGMTRKCQTLPIRNATGTVSRPITIARVRIRRSRGTAYNPNAAKPCHATSIVLVTTSRDCRAHLNPAQFHTSTVGRVTTSAGTTRNPNEARKYHAASIHLFSRHMHASGRPNGGCAMYSRRVQSSSELDSSACISTI